MEIKVNELKQLLEERTKVESNIAPFKRTRDSHMDILNKQFEIETYEYNKELIVLNDAIKLCKTVLTNLAQDKFKVDPTVKKFEGGIGIRVTKTLEYAEADALKWAIKTEQALNLDKTSFKQFAKIKPLEFVTYTDTVGVTFPAALK